jgi:hypothetical protein
VPALFRIDRLPDLGGHGRFRATFHGRDSVDVITEQLHSWPRFRQVVEKKLRIALGPMSQAAWFEVLEASLAEMRGRAP